MSEPKVAIILVNWNGTEDTLACIRSLNLQTYHNVKIIVVDNNSDIVPSFSSLPRTETIYLNRNRGFAGGNNVAIEHALLNGFDFVWLLNNDTEVDQDCLEKLIRMATNHTKFSFYGSVITFFDDPESIWYGGGTCNTRFGTVGNIDYGKTVSVLKNGPPIASVDWISGCSILVPRRTLEKVGLLDEDLFLYREELEWQLRVARGERCLILKDPLVHHKVGRSTGTTSGRLGWLFMSRNYIKIAMKYRTWPLWLLRWMFDYLLVPLLKGRIKMVRISLMSLMWYRTPGETIVDRLRSGR